MDAIDRLTDWVTDYPHRVFGACAGILCCSMLAGLAVGYVIVGLR